MIRNLKVLGLALVAVFAMSAMVASAASAQNGNGRITSTGPFTLDATEIAGEVNALTAFGGVTKCPGSVITGHKYNVTPHELIPSGAETVTLTPDYEQTTCNVVESGITHKATVTMNGCDYVLHLGPTVGTDSYSTSVDVVCPEGKSIILDVYFSASNENLKVCEITVGPQTGLKGKVEKEVETPVVAKDETNGTGTLKGTYTKIKASKSGTCGAGNTETGEFDIGVLIKGTNAAKENTNVSLSHL